MYLLLNSCLYKFDIIFIQEPWIRNSSTITHSGYNSIIPIPLSNKRPRVITFYSKNMPFEITERQDLLNDEDCQIIDIRYNSEVLRIFNIYNEKQQTTPDQLNTNIYTIDRLYN